MEWLIVLLTIVLIAIAVVRWVTTPRASTIPRPAHEITEAKNLEEWLGKKGEYTSAQKSSHNNVLIIRTRDRQTEIIALQSPKFQENKVYEKKPHPRYGWGWYHKSYNSVEAQNDIYFQSPNKQSRAVAVECTRVEIVDAKKYSKTLCLRALSGELLPMVQLYDFDDIQSHNAVLMVSRHLEEVGLLEHEATLSPSDTSSPAADGFDL